MAELWVRRVGLRSALALGLIHGAIVGPASGQDPFAGPPPQGQGDPAIGGGQVLARGPIHEAFAEPIAFNPAPGPVTPQPPPQTQIEEQPPAQKPQGADVEWIPGYWAWDDERNDYIWISGIWRDIPPGRHWMPGYWNQVANGFQYTPGFWASVAANGQFDYLPQPPQSLEVGPNTPQPGEDFAWAPGSWTWAQDRYVWRPGYWVQAQPNWVWVPSSYVPTPGGYVYNDGYWDYPVANRGVQFAPVAFGPQVYAQQSFAYTPSYALPVSGLLANLFIRPNQNRYYYGDYYGSSGLAGGAGYVPWFGYGQSRLGYDPLYSSMSVLNARRPEWDRGLRDEYRYRVDHREARPPATFAAQRPFLGDEGRPNRIEDTRGVGLARPFNAWASRPDTGHRFVPVGDDHRAELARRQGEVRDVQQARARQEFQGRINPEVRREDQRPQRLDLPRSPVVAAREPRFQSPGLARPPVQPEAHQNFRPTFNQAPPHREPGPAQPRVEPRRESQPRPPHAEPRNENRGAEHERPGGKPR